MPTNTDRALDRRLAELMGWRAEQINHHGLRVWALLSPDGKLAHDLAVWSHPESAEEAWRHCPPFSADTPEGWAAMWMVDRAMRERGYVLYVYGASVALPYQVQFFHKETGRWTPTCEALSLPEAVCRAAIAALEATDAVS